MTVKTENTSGNMKKSVTIEFDTQKELDIFKTLVGYYPYDTMEKLRKEFGNRFPDVQTTDVIDMIKRLATVIDQI